MRARNASIWLLCGLLHSASADAQRPPGTVLPVAPSVAPGGLNLDEDPVSAARERFLQGDMEQVIALLSPHVAVQRTPASRDKSIAHYMLGMAHRQQENWNLAAAHFWWVRTSEQPLAPYAAWYEAEAELQRGRSEGTIEACARLQEAWPDHRNAEECLLLVGDAWALAGNATKSQSHFDQWLQANRGSSRTEAVRLRSTLALARVDPKRAIPRLQQLILDHQYHSSAVSAERVLAELAKQGMDTALPTGTRVDIRQIESARKCGRLDVAWERFVELVERADDDTTALRWVEQNERRIAKQTRNWDALAQMYERQYEQRKDSKVAWRIFNAWSRAGEWQKAVDWGRKGLTVHGGRGRWASGKDDVAWAEIHLGDFEAAAERWASMAVDRGTFGRNAQFYTAFSRYRAGDLKAADKAFTKVISYGRNWSAKGYYWRGRVRAALGDSARAAEDHSEAVKVDRTGWYTALLNQPPDAGTGNEAQSPTLRDGRFAATVPVSLPRFVLPVVRATNASGMGPASAQQMGQRPERLAWTSMGWPMEQTTPPPAPHEPKSLTSLPGSIPDGYVPSQWFETRRATDRLRRFAEANKERWQDLPAAHDLALAGHVSEASRILGATYKRFKKSGGAASAASGAVGGTVRGTMNDWREFFALTRDHYNSARSAIGLARQVEDDATKRHAAKLAYPIVDGPALWDLGEQFGVDPLLMMSIMRQESTYRHAIKSHAGAIGLVQVMPGTGARLAWMMGDETYSPGALEIPAVNLRYGTYYLSMLIERFDGVFPMAIASYNGGPHNVSRWYREHRGNIELDEWAEQIQWRETRDYVKKVIGHYAKYIDLYGPTGARLQLPDRPGTDDADVINF